MKHVIAAILFIMCVHLYGQGPGYYNTHQNVARQSNSQAQQPAPVQATYTISPTDVDADHTSYANLVASVTLVPGDSIAFERGYAYSDSIIIPCDSLTFLDYGTGTKPEITGLYEIPTWNVSGNLWESSAAVSTLNSCNVVVINDSIYPKGIMPNTGHYTIDSHSGSASFTSADLSGLTLNDSMQVVTRPDRWLLNQSEISSISGTTVYTTLGTGYDHKDTWGFFFKNHVLCLDLNFENSYNKGTKKLNVYHSGSLPPVYVGRTTNLVDIVEHRNITFKNLRFTGADSAAIYLKNAKYITLDNCEIEYCFDAVRGEKPKDTTGDPEDSKGLTLRNCSIKNMLNCGVFADEDFGKLTVDSVYFENIGQWMGMGASNDGSYTGVRAMGDSAYVAYCQFIKVGYNPISFDGVGSQVYRNFIDTYNNIKDDGAAIYCARQDAGRGIEENIFKNGIGTNALLPATAYDEPWEIKRPKGIYLDDDAQDVRVVNNTGFNVVDNMLFLHGNHGYHYIVGNLFVNSQGWNGIYSIAQDDPTADLTNMVFKHNILVAYSASQRVASALTHASLTLTGYGVSDSNYYCSPLATEAIMNYDTDMNTPGSTNTNLAGWRTAMGTDANSVDPLISVSSTNDIFYNDNWSHSIKAATLPAGTWQDVYGNTYSGTVNVQPFRGVVLFKM